WGRGREGARGATTPSPSYGGRTTISFGPDDGGRPAGHFLPALGSGFTSAREAAFTAGGGSLGSRARVTRLRQRVADEGRGSAPTGGNELRRCAQLRPDRLAGRSRGPYHSP